MKEIRIIGFDGTGFRDPRYSSENVLIRSGHVGLSFDRGKTIYGFRPSEKAILALVAEGYNILTLLKQGTAIVGQVYDDTFVFHRAHHLSITGTAQTAVWQMIVSAAETLFNSALQEILKQVNSGSPYPSWYRFPARFDTPMPEQCNNCATFPRVLNIKIPDESGQLSVYIPILESKNERWTGEM